MASYPTFGSASVDTVRPFNTGGSGTGLGPSSGSMPVPGANQYMGSPGMAVPGNTASPVNTSYPIATTPGAGYNQNKMTTIPVGSSYGLGKGTGAQTIPTFDPIFTAQFYSWLQEQLGKGATPFGGTTSLPTGGQTAPGQLTAPLNPLEQSLSNFYQTGQGGPMPGVMPMWNATIAAMNGPQGPVAQQEALLRGQFAFSGDLASSPFAQAMTQFGEQTALNQNALLTQATLSALPTMQDFAGGLQSLDQEAINRQLAEFMRTQPEYSPLLNMLFGGATSSPGVFSKSGKGLGGIGAILGGAGGAMSGIAALAAL